MVKRGGFFFLSFVDYLYQSVVIASLSLPRNILFLLSLSLSLSLSLFSFFLPFLSFSLSFFSVFLSLTSLSLMFLTYSLPFYICVCAGCDNAG